MRLGKLYQFRQLADHVCWLKSTIKLPRPARAPYLRLGFGIQRLPTCAIHGFAVGNFVALNPNRELLLGSIVLISTLRARMHVLRLCLEQGTCHVEINRAP